LEKHKNIAIIGSGISGLGAAYLLHPHHNITLYEKNDYIGGHSRTVDIKLPEGTVPVDTGFIVFNKRNYPLLTGLFQHLGVKVEKSDMSFGISIKNGLKNGWLEYGTRQTKNIFAQKSNLLNPKFLRMVWDILKFNRRAHHYLNAPPSLTLGQCLKEMKLGEWFKNYYLLAMGGAIWSTPLSAMLDFPASTFIRFFNNHGLLTVNDHPQWYTVKNGSREYVKRITENFQGSVLLGCGASKVIRGEDKITIIDTKGNKADYDEVIFACHSNQVLNILENPTTAEKEILSCVRYQPNRMILHRDTSFMPKRKGAWASWVYLSEDKQADACKNNQEGVSLSYWMNNLQPLKTKANIIVTLNPAREPNAELIHDEHWFDHPIFDEKAIGAQEKIDSIQGTDRVWFCGAYQRYGFHEDGLLSAVNVVKKMGIHAPWI